MIKNHIHHIQSQIDCSNNHCSLIGYSRSGHQVEKDSRGREN